MVIGLAHTGTEVSLLKVTLSKGGEVKRIRIFYCDNFTSEENYKNLCKAIKWAVQQLEEQVKQLI